MISRFIRLLTACIATAAIFAACRAHQSPLVYNGRTIDDWLSDLGPQKKEEVRHQAMNAIRSMGTNVLPYLIGELNDVDHSRIIDQSNIKDTGLRVQHERLFTIHSAFTALGPLARPAVPELSHLVDGGRNGACTAARALMAIGQDGVLILLRPLTNGPLDVRICLAGFMPEAGTNAYLAVPSLMQCLTAVGDDKEKVAELKSFAAASLGDIGSNLDIVVPALVKSLEDKEWSVRFRVARTLGKFGNHAQLAIPALKKALDDPDRFVRSAAAEALKQISS